jgi:hypothetical protein
MPLAVPGWIFNGDPLCPGWKSIKWDKPYQSR